MSFSVLFHSEVCIEVGRYLQAMAVIWMNGFHAIPLKPRRNCVIISRVFFTSRKKINPGWNSEKGQKRWMDWISILKLLSTKEGTNNVSWSRAILINAK